MRRPNVILVTVDSLRADAVGAAGAPSMRTPDLDRLYRSGLAFSQAMHSGGQCSRVGVQDRFRIIACRTPAWKLITDEEGQREELYDLAHDPGERHDLIAERRGVADSMRRSLREHDELVLRAAASYEGARGERIVDGDEDVRCRSAALGYL